MLPSQARGNRTPCSLRSSCSLSPGRVSACGQCMERSSCQSQQRTYWCELCCKVQGQAEPWITSSRAGAGWMPEHFALCTWPCGLQGLAGDLVWKKGFFLRAPMSCLSPISCAGASSGSCLWFLPEHSGSLRSLELLPGCGLPLSQNNPGSRPQGRRLRFSFAQPRDCVLPRTGG